MIDRDYLVQRLDYDSKSGHFTWKAGSLKGRRAGWHGGSGWQIVVDQQKHRAHRLAWLLMTGEWPSSEIDHKDGDPTNNAWSNLRLATRSQNLANRRGWSASGLKGVAYTPSGRWRAQIHKDGRTYRLGVYDTPEEAHAAYIGAAKVLHGEFARAA